MDRGSVNSALCISSMGFYIIIIKLPCPRCIQLGEEKLMLWDGKEASRSYYNARPTSNSNIEARPNRSSPAGHFKSSWGRQAGCRLL